MNKMQLLIMSRHEARNYEPLVNTYAIRIFSSELFYPDDKLQGSLFYKVIQYYLFDDIEPGRFFGPGIMFNEDIAARILRDFQEHREGVEALLVHCTFGKNRSPAVAIALNEIFSLGNDSEALKKQYDQLNKHVYNVLKETASKLEITATSFP